MGSTRLPNKMSEELGGFSIIEWVISRCKQSKLINKLVLATSSSVENDYLIKISRENLVESYRGSENNVLSRFVEISLKEKADIIVRICADNPLIDSNEIDKIIESFLNNDSDYSFNHIPAMNNNYVDGIGAEVFSSDTLYRISNLVINPIHFEHVTKYIWDNQSEFSINTINAPTGLDFPNVRLDIDTKNDFMYAEFLLNKCSQVNIG